MRALYLACRWLPFTLSSLGRERKREKGGEGVNHSPPLLIKPKFNWIRVLTLKSLSPDTVTTGVRISTYDWGGEEGKNNSVHSTHPHHLMKLGDRHLGQFIHLDAYSVCCVIRKFFVSDPGVSCLLLASMKFL